MFDQRVVRRVFCLSCLLYIRIYLRYIRGGVLGCSNDRPSSPRFYGHHLDDLFTEGVTEGSVGESPSHGSI